MMETTLVEAELTMKPSAARDWADVVGWSSSKVSTASDKLPVTAATTLKEEQQSSWRDMGFHQILLIYYGFSAFVFLTI